MLKFITIVCAKAGWELASLLSIANPAYALCNQVCRERCKAELEIYATYLIQSARDATEPPVGLRRMRLRI